MPIEAVKIPQNVQIEDKVVGPLSLRQILIIAIGGGFSYMLYALAQKSMGHVGIPLTIILWTPAVISAAFALVNINDLSLLRICFLLLEKTQKPSTRTWAPRGGISITIRTSAAKTAEEVATKAMPSGSERTAQQQIAELTSVVDRDAATPDAAPLAVQPQEIPQPTPALAATRPPVNPDAIRVDDPLHPSLPPVSDLSVFRDVLPPQSTWPS